MFLVFLTDAFITYIYQPFFNVLVGIYWLLGRVTDTPDMGIAVIIFALIVRFVLLPLNLAGQRTAKERDLLVARLKAIKHDHAHDPIRQRSEEKRLFRSSPGAVIAETLNIFIQLIIILMLYRIFKTGLEGADLHLLYPFMPAVSLPINLMFLGKYDLSVTNSFLNLLQSLAILVLESLSLLFSDKPVSRREFLSLVIFFPVVSYLVFMFLPAGKKVFIITTLSFSIVFVLVKQLVFWYHELIKRLTPPPPVSADQTSNT